MKSSYFNYDNAEVKEALDNFMGILSQNISIDQTYFSPLLKKAVSQALLVVFDPYDFFSILVSGKNNVLDVASFREEIKYLKINRAPLERLLQRLEEKSIEHISGNEAFGMLDVILEEVNFTPEDVDEYMDQFSAIVPLDPSRFYVAKSTQPITPPPAPVQEVKLQPASAPRTNQPKANTYQSAQNNPLNEKSNNTPRATVAGNFMKIGKIKDSLSINQKFMFTKVLFHGDFELFSKAVDDLDRQDNIKGAMRYLEENYDDWDQESEEFHEFMELVEKRFN